jgi:diguanylate cyclase (GGDEF)-like protein
VGARRQDAVPPVLEVSAESRRLVRVLEGAVVVALGVYTVSTVVRPAGYDGLFEGWLYAALSAACVALCLMRRLWVRQERRAWLALGIGLLLTTSGTLYYSQVVAKMDPVPSPSLSDALWLAFYPFAYATLVLLFKSGVKRFHTSLWLDGLVGALGIAAVGIAFVLRPIMDAATGSPAAVITSLAFPLADLMLLGMIAGLFALHGWRPGRALGLLGAGLALFAVADTVYLLRVATETYEQGTLLDAIWPAGVTCMALAAWRRPGESRSITLEGWVVLLVPTLCVLAAIGLLVFDHLRPASWVVDGLAVATLLVAMVRTGLTFREVRALADTRRQAHTDELTGLGNRRLLQDRLGAALAARQEGEGLALLLVDLDRFKEINDSLGHHVGDELLRQLGPRFGRGLRSGDVLARLGGDEFALLLGPGGDASFATTVAQRILAHLEEPFRLEGVDLHIDASVGIALAPEHASDFTGLLQRADVAMYQAKHQGTGWELYDPERDHHSRDRLETIEQLRAAVQQGQLVLHYQPKIDLRSGRVVGVEALVRWNHPERGLVYPDQFLLIAEQTGLMRPLTLAVLEMALGQCRAWRDEGLELSVAVNLSVTSLLDTRLPHDVERLLSGAGLRASALELEITENILMADPVRARNVVTELRELGIQVSIDDYGTGYSSLSYLRELPVDELKLDRSFVMHLAGNPGAAAIVRSTVELAHSLGLRMVAEGVEDETSLVELTGFGCDMAQGYHIRRPGTAAELAVWLKDRMASVGPARNRPLL